MPTTVFRHLLFLSLSVVQISSYAATAHEREQLSLVQQQLDTIERVTARTEVAITSEPGDRYRFDYPRLIQDIQRMRQGVQSYLSPSRAQPRDPTELVGDYRLDTLPTEPSP